mmetsp:Transcript_40704/g.63556  ORF Transcript_40704/g.63556 Transcript_40704/m.63556 type:complete len:415 (+) Transcript_40704:175-1419(+)
MSLRKQILSFLCCCAALCGTGLCGTGGEGRRGRVVSFEADYFTDSSDPVVQLECKGGECSGLKASRLVCSSAPEPLDASGAAVVASFAGCQAKECGTWTCEAEGLGAGLRLLHVSISCGAQSDCGSQGEEGAVPQKNEELAWRWLRSGACSATYSLVAAESAGAGARTRTVAVHRANEDSKATVMIDEQEKKASLGVHKPTAPQPAAKQAKIVETPSGSQDKGDSASVDTTGDRGSFDLALGVVLGGVIILLTTSSCKTRWKRLMSNQTLTPEERKEVERLFKEIDTDGSGALDAQEMKVALTQLGFRGVTEQQLGSLMYEADLDGNGQIEEEEFVALLVKYKKSGKVNFGAAVQQVINRDFQHLKRNWWDEASQFLALLCIMAVLMLFLYKMGELAEHEKAKNLTHSKRMRVK